MSTLIVRVLGATVLVLSMSSAVNGQSIEAHGFADLGLTRFTASESFKAVLGTSTGMVFGGGGGIMLPQQIFVTVRASRFRKDGQRVVVVDGQTFDLGIENTITITPLELTGGYKFGRTRDTVRPYVGGGVSWYKYRETDAFATSAEAVNETFTGLHALGGIEYRVHRYVGIGGEGAWSRIPDALGQQPGSVGTAFGESDLGGTTLRVKVVIGR